MVILPPPAVLPFEGEIELIVGEAKYVYPPVEVAVPPLLLRTTLTTPADFAGVTTVTEVEVLKVTAPAVPPNNTELVLLRFVPVMVTVVPPATGPLEGVIDVIEGGKKT